MISVERNQKHKDDINNIRIKINKRLHIREGVFFYICSDLIIFVSMELKDLYDIYQKHPVVSTDTRKITEGCLFFALSGSNFDGNKFAAESLEKGAAFAIISDPALQGDKYIQVENTLATLQALSNYHRRHFDIPVIAITGSNGKTTTKELVSSVLGGKYKVHATQGNYNNHIGVPLTLLAMPADTEITVIEMGANHIGEIKELCEIAMPTHGLITNIGRAHLEGFGSVEGVRIAKGELFDYLKSTNGYAFVNSDDPSTRALGHQLIEKTNYGLNKEENPNVLFEYDASSDDGGFSIRDEKGNVEIHSAMFGHYNAINMVAAYTVGKHFDVEENKIIQLLSGFVPGANRSEIISFNNTTVVKDAYNANPSSMEVSIRSFADRFGSGIVVLGSMKELGNESIESHQSMIALVNKLNFKKAFFVGQEFKEAFVNLNQPLYPGFTFIEDVDNLKKQWNWNEMQGKAILLKGSRSIQLEKLLED